MPLTEARILYFGDPQGALALLDRGVPLVGVVHGRPGGPGWQALVPRVRHLPRWFKPDLEAPEVVAALAALKPTLLVSGFYPRRIPPPVLALAPGVNVHPSDLPRWRGPDPAWWAIREGDAHTAVCVHDLAQGLDEGAVLYREAVAIGPRESGGHLAVRMERKAAEVLGAVVARMVAGERFTPQPQEGEVTWAPLVDPDDVEVAWTQPAEIVDRLVRAAAPDPGAFTGIGDELLVIYSGTPVAAGRFAGLAPGTPFVRGGVAHIKCGEGAFRLGWLRLGKRRLTGRELAGLLL
ncbi:MAG: hypothetical protein H6702_22790 [Myxococcales bacterium]|nr:hypothetical protein [Myxococcales bacterium]